MNGCVSSAEPESLRCSREQVLPVQIAATAAADPDRPFIRDVGGRSLTYGQFHREMLRCCSVLRDLGLRAGDRVASFLPSSVDATLLWLGAGCLGVYEVAVNRELRGEFLRHVLTDAGVRVCFVRPEDAHVPAESGVPGLHVVVVERDGSLVAGAPELAVPEYPSPGDVAAVLYTSGTTGPAKGVLVTWAQLSTAAGRIPRSWLSEHDVHYSPWPMFHLSGRAPTVTMADIGGGVVCRERTSVSAFWSDVDTYGCTISMVSPIARLLLAAPPSIDDAHHCLRVVHLGGPAAIPFQERFRVRAVTNYGSTEMGFVAVKRTVDESAVGVTGWLRPGYRARIVDDAGNDVPDGTVGELWVAPPSPELIMRGYLGQPERTRQVLAGGWYRTGDAFVRRPDGALRFVDRMGDTIRRFGENISAKALEDAVIGEIGVLDCAAVGVPSDVAGQEVLLAVVPAPGPAITPAELFDRLRHVLPRHMLPAFLAVVEGLPKTPNGKVRRGELRDLAASGGAWESPVSAAARPASGGRP